MEYVRLLLTKTLLLTKLPSEIEKGNASCISKYLFFANQGKDGSMTFGDQRSHSVSDQV